MNKEFERSIKAAELEFKEEPMEKNYKNPIVGIISRGRVDKLLHEMGSLKGKKVLDIGCEAGYVSIEMAKKGADVYSLDIIRQALKDYKKKSPEAKIFLAAAQKLPLADSTFDHIVCTEVIEHMPKLDVCFAEMKRVLKPTGKLFLTFPNEKLRKTLYPLAKLCGINTSVEKDVTLYEYKFSKILNLCKKNFKIKKKYSWPSVFPLTRFVVCGKG